MLCAHSGGKNWQTDEATDGPLLGDDDLGGGGRKSRKKHSRPFSGKKKSKILYLKEN